MTTDWKAKEAVSYLTAQPMREITTRTQQLDFPSSSRLRGSCRLFLEANTATRRPEKSTAERSRTKKKKKKSTLNCSWLPRSQQYFKKAEKEGMAEQGDLRGSMVQLASPNSSWARELRVLHLFWKWLPEAWKVFIPTQESSYLVLSGDRLTSAKTSLDKWKLKYWL